MKVNKKGLWFTTLEHNSKVTVLTDPVRIMSLQTAVYFMIPYLYANGLTEVQYGNAQSVANGVGFVLGLFTPALTNRLGRKRTTMMFLDIPFFAALLSLIFGESFFSLLLFTIGGIALPKVGKTAYMLLITENEKQEKRAFVLGCLIAVPMAAGLIYPIIGKVIARYDTSIALRNTYLLLAALFFLNFLFRIRLYRETDEGKRAMQRLENHNVWNAFSCYLTKIPHIVTSPRYILLTLLDFLNYAISYMSMVTSSYLLGNAIVTQVQYSNLSIGVAAFNLIGNFILVPQIIRRRINEKHIFILCGFLGALSLLGMTIVGTWGYGVLFCLNTLYGFVTFFVFTFNDSIIINSIPANELSDVYGTMQVIGSFMLIPVPMLYGKILLVNATLAMYLCAGIWAVTSLVVVMLRLIEKDTVSEQIK